MAHDYPVTNSEEVYRGRLFGLRRDEVRMPGGSTAVREVLVHPGAVIIAAVDGEERLVLVHQYRHPVRRYLWELPAGLLDVNGEPPHLAAARELAEEAGLVAARWNLLLDLAPSPGISEETVRVFLARELSDVPEPERYVPDDDEESDMRIRRIPVEAAVRMALTGELENSATVAGVLAVARARSQRWLGLRPVDAPWAARA
ncbi:MAG TPA: NUDIX hydrolase [Mycobacteriales bacterium]|nr:NUDIX hydrolase [Mycobacteriales bacterium]